MLKVTDVEYMGDYSLLCQFSDGKKKYVNLEPLLKYPMFKIYHPLCRQSPFQNSGISGTPAGSSGTAAPELRPPSPESRNKRNCQE